MSEGRAILLPVGEDVFAVPVQAVREVVAVPRTTPVPTAPASVLGLFNLRGEVLPILDTGHLLEGRPLDRTAFAIIVQCQAEKVALAASALPVMVGLGAPVQDSETPGTAGTHLVGDQLVTVVEPGRLLAHAGLGIDERAPAGG